MQSLKDAARIAVQDVPGGLVAICARFDWNYETTRKELAGAPGFKLDADKLLLISQVCVEAGGASGRAIFNAWNMAHGIVAQLPIVDAMPEQTLIGATVGLVQDSTNVLAAVTTARADGVVSDNERKTIEKHATRVIADMQAVLQEVARENEAGHSHLRKV